MRSVVRWLSIAMAIAFLSFVAARKLTVTTLAQSPLQVVPFTFETETYNFESDPAGKLVYKRLMARRQDGATASVASVGLVQWGATTRKVTFPDGMWANVYDIVGAKTTWHMNSVSLAALKARLQNPPANCVFNTEGNPTFLRNEQLLGHSVAVIQTVTKTERGTFWRAPDLACEELQFRYESLQGDGSYKVASEERLITLNVGSPDSRLFELGPALKEMKPSDAHKLFFNKLPIPEDDATKRVSEEMDQKYLSGTH